MSLELSRAQVELFRRQERAEQERIVSNMTDGQLLALDAAFEVWAHDGQLEPGKGGWITWLMLAGRGFGKTRAGAEWILALGKGRPVRIALVGATIDEARSVMVEGPSGLMTISKRRRMNLMFEPSKREVRWPNGSIATLDSGENPDGLRGPEHHFAWCWPGWTCWSRRR